MPDWLSCSSPIYVIILDFIRSRTIYKWYVKPFAYWNWCLGSPWKRIIRMGSGTCSKHIYAYAHIIIKEFKGIRCLYISILHWLNYRFRPLLYSLMYFLYRVFSKFIATCISIEKKRHGISCQNYIFLQNLSLHFCSINFLG